MFVFIDKHQKLSSEKLIDGPLFFVWKRYVPIITKLHIKCNFVIINLCLINDYFSSILFLEVMKHGAR